MKLNTHTCGIDKTNLLSLPLFIYFQLVNTATKECIINSDFGVNMGKCATARGLNRVSMTWL